MFFQGWSLTFFVFSCKWFIELFRKTRTSVHMCQHSDFFFQPIQTNFSDLFGIISPVYHKGMMALLILFLFSFSSSFSSSSSFSFLLTMHLVFLGRLWFSKNDVRFYMAMTSPTHPDPQCCHDCREAGLRGRNIVVCICFSVCSECFRANTPAGARTHY